MMLTLPTELEAFASRQIEEGRYASLEEVLTDGLRALIEREQRSHSTQDLSPPKLTLKDRLQGKLGTVHFQPHDLSERTQDAFMDLLQDKQSSITDRT